MRPETMTSLDRLNRCFYAARADEFSATRQAPWPSWSRVLDRYRSCRSEEHARHSILDVGCGNGRFAAFLSDRLDNDWSYLGIDSSVRLTAIASREACEGVRFCAADVVNRSLPLPARTSLFDLVVAFGLLHHVPSWERRRSLLVELAGRLRPGGVLAVSFWQFASEPRFTKRIVPWEEYNRTADEPIDPWSLEAGDHLLRWGDEGAVRYCHFAGAAEAAELTAASGLRRLETFRGDGACGRLNLYHLLRHDALTGL